MKLVLIAGARPNFMKIGPILTAIDKHNRSNERPRIDHLLVHTGQHYDYEMSKVFFEDLNIPEPDVHLAIGSGTHAEQTGRAMIEIEKVLLEATPDMLVVVGDVNSTLAGALAAAKLHIPVAHVEAGVRSYDRAMPEEINRLLTDHVSDFLFTTSKYDDDNLAREGIPESRIHRVGNVMADSILFATEMARKSDTLSRVGLGHKEYALLTLHRPSNVDDKDRLARILGTMTEIARRLPVIFPVHPRTRKNLIDFGLLPDQQPASGADRLLVIDPLRYVDFLNVEMNAKFVITDSGGVQVETTILGVPCLTMLDAPVWPVTHEQGTNILVGSNSQRMLHEAFQILDGKAISGRVPDLWDGKAAERIVATLVGGLMTDIPNPAGG